MTKTFKKSVAFLSAVAMVMAMLLYFPSGIFSNIDWGLKASAEGITLTEPSKDGSGVYQIGTAAELYWFAQQVNGVNTALNAVLTANITVNTGVLKTDGSLADDTSGFTSWTPIGNDLNPYTGTFDGQGHTISGLYHSSGSDYVGLFGYVGTNGSVSNVGVVDSYFKGSYNVGGVCGQNDGKITNCYNTGYVSGTGDMVGGVCGYNYASSSGTATIENCYNTGAVSGNFYVGGVCGWNYASHGIATIKNCYNTGEVSGTNNGVGGVCGYNFAYDGIATITKCCYLEGCNAVGTSFSCTEGTSKSSEEFESGAVCELVGYHSPQASNDFKCIHCEKYDEPKKVSDTHHSELNITHKDYYAIENASQLYWFAGLVNGDSKVCTGSVNKNTGAKAVLTADITVNTDVLNENGELNATNANTFKEWTPIGNEDNKYTGTFDGNGKTISGLYFNDSGANYVGLFGYSSGTIKNVGVVDSYFNGKENVGGVCGYNEWGIITNCYNTGNVSGSSYVGGVCGYSSGGTITNCYNTGAVSGNSNVGGVCGYNYGGTFKNCYYLAESETDIIDGTTFKTTAQFESGEVAYLLSKGENGSIWGQTLTGDNKQDYPVLGGTKVYQVNVYEGCEGNPGEPSTAYSNTNAPVYVDHDDTNGDGMCDYCDKLIHSVVKEVSATLDGDIGLNYYIALPESVTADTGAYVQFTVNGQDTKVFVKDVTDIEGSVYKFTCWLTAKEMSDDVTFKLYDGNGTLIDIYSNSGDKVEGASFDYSLETYLNTLSSDENAALKDLADATLVYGAYAQNAFNHNADPNLDGSELADVTVGTLEANKITKSADIPEGLKLTEMTLILETETTLRLYFKSDNIGNYTFKLDGNDVTLNTIAEEGLYYVEIANISAKDLDTKHTLIINDNCELTFNALSYAYATVKAGMNENICNVVKALYKYNDAANAYFGE